MTVDVQTGNGDRLKYEKSYNDQFNFLNIDDFQKTEFKAINVGNESLDQAAKWLFNKFDSAIPINGYHGEMNLEQLLNALKDMEVFAKYATDYLKIQTPFPINGTDQNRRQNMMTVLENEIVRDRVSKIPEELTQCVILELIEKAHPAALLQTALLLTNAFEESNFPNDLSIEVGSYLSGNLERKKAYRLTRRFSGQNSGELYKQFLEESQNLPELERKLSQKLQNYILRLKMQTFNHISSSTDIYTLIRDGKVPLEIIGRTMNIFFRGYNQNETPDSEQVLYYYRVIVSTLTKRKVKEAGEYDLAIVQDSLDDQKKLMICYFMCHVIDELLA